eukprot:IDg9837t1
MLHGTQVFSVASVYAIPITAPSASHSSVGFDFGSDAADAFDAAWRASGSSATSAAVVEPLIAGRQRSSAARCGQFAREKGVLSYGRILMRQCKRKARCVQAALLLKHWARALAHRLLMRRAVDSAFWQLLTPLTSSTCMAASSKLSGLDNTHILTLFIDRSSLGIYNHAQGKTYAACVELAPSFNKLVLHVTEHLLSASESCLTFSSLDKEHSPLSATLLKTVLLRMSCEENAG